MPLTKTLRQLASISGGDARFRELCEQLPVGVFVIDVRDYCTYANAAARAILGIEPDQTLGEAWAHYLHPDDAAEVSRQWQLAVESQTELVNEYRCQLPGRPETWVRSHAVPEFDDEGRLIGFIGYLRDFTEERQASQQLREQERFFRTIFAQAGVGVGVLDSNTGQFIEVNHKYSDLIGYTPEELKERTFQSLTHPDDLHDNLGQWKKLITGELGSLSMQKRYVHKDGHIVWVQLTITPLWNPGEAPTHHVTMVEDITLRKAAEEQLRESEMRFRLLCEQAPVGISLSDAHGRPIYINPRAYEITGVSESEVKSGNWVSRLHPEDRARVPDLWRSAIASQSRYENESRYVHDDGTVRRTSSIAIPLRNASNEVTSWVGIVVDITEQYEAMLALKASEAQYRDLFNANTDALFLCALDGRVVEVNDGTCRMMGYEREEFLKLDPHVFVHPDSYHHYAGFIESCKRGESFHCEAKNIRKNGSVIDIDVHGMRLMYRGEPHAFAIVRDISRRKASEAELRRQETLLAHVSRLSTMGEMVAGIAHEVNQPLYSIVNFAKAVGNLLAGDDSVTAEHVRSWNDEIYAAAERAGEIVRRMRDFTRRSAETRQIEDLNDVLRESMDLVQYELRRAKVQVELHLDGDLPCVAVDRVQIQQVQVNLLKNAIEALDSREEAGRRVRVSTHLAGDFICVAVADNGAGLKKPGSGDPFEPFVTTKPEGMGMGLPISRTIVEAHGGTITAKNNEWGGATFTFCIPVVRSAE